MHAAKYACVNSKTDYWNYGAFAMTMTRLGDGSRRSGYFTGLSIARQFANAICHLLRDHPWAKPHVGGGKEIPLDETIWQEVIALEYPNAGSEGQTLKAYCEYYNSGTHGHGYDQEGVWDCGTSEKRRPEQRVGQSLRVKNRDKMVHPGSEPPFLKPMEVIEFIYERLDEIPTNPSRGNMVEMDTVEVEDVNAIWSREDIGCTTKETLVSARLGQGRFRTQVLCFWDNCCCVTSSRTCEIIRASHIKPWRESTDKERLDPHNGLPLIATLDALFDTGLISFESSGELIVSSKLDLPEREILGIKGNEVLMKEPTAKTAAYLTDHRRRHGFFE